MNTNLAWSDNNLAQHSSTANNLTWQKARQTLLCRSSIRRHLDGSGDEILWQPMWLPEQIPQKTNTILEYPLNEVLCPQPIFGADQYFRYTYSFDYPLHCDCTPYLTKSAIFFLSKFLDMIFFDDCLFCSSSSTWGDDYPLFRGQTKLLVVTTLLLLIQAVIKKRGGLEYFAKPP